MSACVNRSSPSTPRNLGSGRCSPVANSHRFDREPAQSALDLERCLGTHCRLIGDSWPRRLWPLAGPSSDRGAVKVDATLLPSRALRLRLVQLQARLRVCQGPGRPRLELRDVHRLPDGAARPAAPPTTSSGDRHPLRGILVPASVTLWQIAAGGIRSANLCFPSCRLVSPGN